MEFEDLAGAGGEVLADAFDQFRTSFDHLLKLLGDAALDDRDIVVVGQAFERERNRLELFNHWLVEQVRVRGLPEVFCQGSPQRLLASALLLSPGEASRRVRAADAVGNRTSMLGEPLDPVRPVLAAAQRAGQVSPEHVAVVERALAEVDRRGFDPVAIADGEVLLTEFASRFGPKELRRLADQVVERIDPDGTVPDDALNADRRRLVLRQTTSGAWVGEFRLTGVAGAKLRALLDPLARPRTDTDLGVDSGVDGDARAESVTDADSVSDVSVGTDAARLHMQRRRRAQIDARSHQQRMHDALEELCDRALREGSVQGPDRAPATVVVHVDADRLLTGRGAGTTDSGAVLSMNEIRRLANTAEIFTVLHDAHRQPLELRRTRRLASRAQSIALQVRDGGCSFPGCAMPPPWCERHHVQDWAKGGATDLNNLTLLCSYHHRHFSQRGWTCQMNHAGLPTWIPPAWIDPQRRPSLHPRLHRPPITRRQSTARISGADASAGAGS